MADDANIPLLLWLLPPESSARAGAGADIGAGATTSCGPSGDGRECADVLVRELEDDDPYVVAMPGADDVAVVEKLDAATSPSVPNVAISRSLVSASVCLNSGIEVLMLPGFWVTR